MNQDKNAKEHFELQYQRKGFFSPRDIQFLIYDREIWDFAKKLLQNCQTVVDLGAGGGTLLYNVSRVSAARIIAIDFADIAVSFLRKMFPQAVVLKEDVTQTSLADESSDFVMSTMTIEHVDDRKLLREANRILREEGYFLVTTVLRSPKAWYFYKDKQGKSALEPTHLREYGSLAGFLELLNKSGFKVLKAKTPKIKYPLIDPIVKLVFGFFRNKFWNSLPETSAIEFLRKISRIPIPGYCAIEVIAQKKSLW